jgi:hypothetical protein
VGLGELPSDVEGSVEEAIELGDGRLARRVELTPPARAGRLRSARRRGARAARRRLSGFDGVVVYREPPADDAPDEERDVRDAFAAGVTRQLRDGAVGVETLTTDPSQVAWYEDALGVSVDNVDVPAGELALVLVLEEAVVGGVTGEPPEGAYGFKDSSDQALPDLDLSD